jgi:uncharacterized membrane protein YraQ (UPF0718 family)
MSTEVYVIYGLAVILTTLGLIKNPKKTKIGLKKGLKSFLNLMPILLPMFLVIGLFLTLITPKLISSLLGEESGFFGVVFGLGIGSITFMPPFVAFPLGKSLLENGGAYPQVAGFLVTLMSIGFVYFQAESRYFSKKSAIFRNLVSFTGAIIVVFVVWVVYL